MTVIVTQHCKICRPSQKATVTIYTLQLGYSSLMTLGVQSNFFFSWGWGGTNRASAKYVYLSWSIFFLSRPVANILRSKIWEVGSWEKLRGGVLVWIIGKQTGNKRRSGLGLSRQTFKSVFYCEQLPVEKCSPDDTKKNHIVLWCFACRCHYMPSWILGMVQ